MVSSAKATKRRTKVEQREASLEKLLSAARHLFVSKGYASTTLEEIAAAVEMTKGSVYFYFGSKEAVLLELYLSGELAYTFEKIRQVGMMRQMDFHSHTSASWDGRRGATSRWPTASASNPT